LKLPEVVKTDKTVTVPFMAAKIFDKARTLLAGTGFSGREAGVIWFSEAQVFAGAVIPDRCQ